jgi:hypothetical protein
MNDVLKHVGNRIGMSNYKQIFYSGKSSAPSSASPVLCGWKIHQPQRTGERKELRGENKKAPE